MFLKRLGIGKGEGKKKSGFFLEAPEAAKEALSDAKAALEKPTEALKAAAEKPAEAFKAVKEALTPTPEVTANGAAEAAPKEKKFKKTKSKSDDAPQAAASQAAPVVPAPKAMPAPAAPATATFASEHLLPKNTPRRRPGPSLDMFKDMAKQVSPRR